MSWFILISQDNARHWKGHPHLLSAAWRLQGNIIPDLRLYPYQPPPCPLPHGLRKPPYNWDLTVPPLLWTSKAPITVHSSSRSSRWTRAPWCHLRGLTPTRSPCALQSRAGPAHLILLLPPSCCSPHPWVDLHPPPCCPGSPPAGLATWSSLRPHRCFPSRLHPPLCSLGTLHP